MRLIPLTLALLLPMAALADQACHVVAVESGASLTCRSAAGRDQHVALRGIDVPSSITATARDRLAALVGDRQVTLRQPRAEESGRIIAAVWATPPDCPGCGHTLDVGRALLSTGLARWRPDPAQGEEERAQYGFEEQEARARKVGLWVQARNAQP